MSKVFEALQRHQQQNRNDKGASRDPLASEIGTPDNPPDGQHDGLVDGQTPRDAKGNRELPSVIDVPTDTRSNEETIFPSFSSDGDEQQVSTPQSSFQNAAPSLNYRLFAEKRFSTAATRKPPLDVQDRQTTGRDQRAEQFEESPSPGDAQREIPVEPLTLSKLHPRLILMTEPQAPECEQYRTLRTQLFHAAEKRKVQVVTVTSALAGEGKTATLLNLAIAIAQSKEKRVLVIDGDLRNPNIASYLGLRTKLGLEEMLGGENDVLSSIFCLDGHELYILPVSHVSQNPTELLSSERFGEMLRVLRRYFDYILMDSPPVVPFADARLLANLADAVILVVRAGMVPYETVEKAIDALPPERILGVVLNGAEHLSDTNYYNYYYSLARREGHQLTMKGRFSSKIRRSWLGKRVKF